MVTVSWWCKSVTVGASCRQVLFSSLLVGSCFFFFFCSLLLLYCRAVSEEPIRITQRLIRPPFFIYPHWWMLCKCFFLFLKQYTYSAGWFIFSSSSCATSLPTCRCECVARSKSGVVLSFHDAKRGGTSCVLCSCCGPFFLPSIPPPTHIHFNLPICCAILTHLV